MSTTANAIENEQVVRMPDPESFDAFYHGAYRRLLRYAYGLTGNLEEAQDFTQEAFARAWQHWRKVRGYDNPEAWLRLVVTRLSADRWRRLGVRRAAPQPPPEHSPAPDEQTMLVVAALRELPLDQRRALTLHYLLDRPIAEIAAETGANLNTVNSRLARGRAALAAALSEHKQLAGGRNHVQ